MSMFTAVGGDGEAHRFATVAAVLTEDDGTTPISGATIDFGLDLSGSGSFFPVGSGATDSAGFAQISFPIPAIGEGTYLGAIEAAYAVDGITADGDFLVYAEPEPTPEPSEPPETEEPEVPYEPEQPWEPYPEESTAPGSPESTNPFEGGETYDPYSGESSGDPYSDCTNDYTGDSCVNSYTGGSNLDPYGDGACINPFRGSSNDDAYTSDDGDYYSQFEPDGSTRPFSNLSYSAFDSETAQLEVTGVTEEDRIDRWLDDVNSPEEGLPAQYDAKSPDGSALPEADDVEPAESKNDSDSLDPKIPTRRDEKRFEIVDELAGPAGAIGYDSWLRAEYSETIKTESSSAIDDIRYLKSSAEEGTSAAAALDEAESIARDVKDFRDAARAATQERLLPGGRALSEYVESIPSWEELYSKAGGTRTFETFEEIAASAGRSNAVVDAAAKLGRVAGPLGLAAGVGVAVYNYSKAPEAEKPRVAAEETGGFAGGALGFTASEYLVAGITTTLELSGPVGWVVLGAGLIASGYVGYQTSKGGSSLAGKAFQFFASP